MSVPGRFDGRHSALLVVAGFLGRKMVSLIVGKTTGGLLLLALGLSLYYRHEARRGSVDRDVEQAKEAGVALANELQSIKRVQMAMRLPPPGTGHGGATATLHPPQPPRRRPTGVTASVTAGGGCVTDVGGRSTGSQLSAAHRTVFGATAPLHSPPSASAAAAALAAFDRSSSARGLKPAAKGVSGGGGGAGGGAGGGLRQRRRWAPPKRPRRVSNLLTVHEAAGEVAS